MASDPRAALVIGGSGGLGRAIARRLGAEGWRLGLVGRDARRLDEARMDLAEVQVDLVGVWRADVRETDGIGRVIGEFAGRAGRMDALIYAAGRLSGIGPLESLDSELAWEDVVTSLKGFANAVRAALPQLRQTGGSITTLIGPGYNGELAHASLYAAAQAGLARLVESLAREIALADVVVYAVYPGVTPTPFMQRLLDEPESRRWLPRFTEAFAEGKEVEPAVGAEMVAWLAREQPTALSGRVIPALQTPDLLKARLGHYARDGELGRLRLR
jgi:NAD(P)-dependent dehydrogenase (short-subunit alcohol dehydrogenase family)